VAKRLRDGLDLAERLLLLLEVLLEETDRLGLAERARHLDQARVGRDLVVLRARGRAGVDEVDERVRALARQLVVLLLQTFEADAFLGLRLLSDGVEDL